MSKNDNDSLNPILLRLKNGDKTAFKTIFETYYKRLFAYASNYVNDKYAAEEIVENTLLKLWQKRNKADKIESLKSYLYTMVRNASLDFLKKESKLIRLDPKEHNKIPSKTALIIEEETHTLLYEALEKLPEKCRKVFELSCIDGLKYKDIAEDLQISVNTVKSQRARAISLLKSYLKDHPFYMLLLNIL